MKICPIWSHWIWTGFVPRLFLTNQTALFQRSTQLLFCKIRSLHQFQDILSLPNWCDLEHPIRVLFSIAYTMLKFVYNIGPLSCEKICAPRTGRIPPCTTWWRLRRTIGRWTDATEALLPTLAGRTDGNRDLDINDRSQSAGQCWICILKSVHTILYLLFHYLIKWKILDYIHHGQ